MSEIARQENNTALAAPTVKFAAPTLISGDVDLQSWARDLADAGQLGAALCKTPFVPKDFQGKPEAAAAAILAGKSLGMDPLASLSNIFVIHGRPGLYARTMHALVVNAGHEVIRTQASPQQVTVLARRKGTDEWQEFVWSMERAQQAGYTKSNAKYKENPIEMLTAKALAEACRVIAPDVLTGVADLSVEDLEDMGERPARPSRTPQPVKAEEPAPSAVPTITGEQWNEIYSAATGAGIENPGQFVAETLGRQLTGWQEITVTEHQQILDKITEGQ
ncbi:hypothetical protein [Glutamicibacter creatinolyticus]|uniref:hypothetical protein n=1 Tax=Glutamicibacter creatinolyticus TaxID=162496 RepID=UPI0032168326